eukprot:scaffold68964_cov78-Cyclotella_meneghiniana.AAC.3
MLLVLAFLIICPKSDAFQQISPSSHVRGVDQNAEGPMRRVSALDMATWSNGQAIKEYQDFLNSGMCEMLRAIN